MKRFAFGVLSLHFISVRNLFAIGVGRYTKPAPERREAFQAAKTLWGEAAEMLVA